MRIRSRVLPLAALATVAAALAGQAQSAQSDRAPVAQVRDQRFKWFFGAEAGALFFSTQSQTSSGIPTVGAHLSVVSRRAGLLIGVDEAFGSNEPTAFLDSTGVVGGVAGAFQQRAVIFDRIRRYGFTLTGYPVRGSLEPYLGVGFGINQVVSPELTDAFTSPDEAARSTAAAQELAATGFASFTAGVQFRVGRLAAFGQYQINSSPAPSSLLRGPMHQILGGLRFSLGSTKEEIKGGGY